MNKIGLLLLVLPFTFCQKRTFSFGTLQECEIARKEGNLAFVQIKSIENNQIFTIEGLCRFENQGSDTAVIFSPKTYMTEMYVSASYYCIGKWKKLDANGHTIGSCNFSKNNKKRFEFCTRSMLIDRQ